jgi:hypothetical protein
MSKLVWDATGTRKFENGVEKGVLYPQNALGLYPLGVAWSGLTTVTEKPSGAESNKQYADNRVYANLISAEEFAATIEAFYSPVEFDACDGTATPYPGVSVGQQPRKPFGFCYKTKIGNDIDPDLGYNLHVVYGAMAAPSERAYTTINDSPELTALSWDLSTDKVDIPGLKPSAIITIDSTATDPVKLAALELVLYGDVAVDPRLPLPAELFGLIGTVLTDATPVAPTYVQGTHTVTIPVTAGIDYQVDGVTKVAGALVITKTTTVIAVPKATYKLAAGVDDDWTFIY